MAFSTDIIFFTILLSSQTRFEQSYFARIFDLIAFLRRSKIISSRCLPRNCRMTANSSLQIAKKRKNHRFAVKPPKCPKGASGAIFEESAFAPCTTGVNTISSYSFCRSYSFCHTARHSNARVQGKNFCGLTQGHFNLLSGFLVRFSAHTTCFLSFSSAHHLYLCVEFPFRSVNN